MAYPNGFRCIVATPTRELFSGEIYYADVPGFEGHYGVIRDHESLVATNHQGGKLVLWLDPDGKETKTFLIHRGCSQMMHNHLSVLGRFGCDIDNIDVENVRAKAESLRAEIDARRAALGAEVEGEGDQHRKADEAWLATEEMHLSWYEAQINFAENGTESYKQ